MSTFKHPSFDTDLNLFDGQLLKATINEGVVTVSRPVAWIHNKIYNLEFNNLTGTAKDALIAIIVTKRGAVTTTISGLEGVDFLCVITSDITIKQIGFSKGCASERYTVSFTVQGVVI